MYSRSENTLAATKHASVFESLGPGILFAATSVGVSHLVQSSRAGASYGLGMLLIILLAHLMKYSAFRSASLYARVTGKSLIYAYQQQGQLPLLLFGFVTISSMSIALAGVTIVAAGLSQAVIGDVFSLSHTALLILVLAASILLRGNYQWLEKISKYLVVFLSVVTIATTIVALPNIDLSVSGRLFPSNWDSKTILFAIALIGWMPTTLDASIWQSIWTVEKSQRESKCTSPASKSLDFHIGYVGTAILAICFCLIGASIMHSSDMPFSNSASGFAGQLIDMYANTLGEWSRIIIGLCALAVMFSTVLTVLDGYPRVLSSLLGLIKNPSSKSRSANRSYNLGVIVHISLGYLLIIFFIDSFKGLIDMAATVAFISAPVIAVFNHRAMCSSIISNEYKLRGKHYVLSVASILLLTGFSLVGLYFMVG